MTKEKIGRDELVPPSIDWASEWSKHGRWLRTVLLARLTDVNAVDDVFQEIALNVTTKPHRWPEPEKIGPWLYRIAIRQVQLFGRRQRRRIGKVARTDEASLESRGDPDPLTWLVRNEAQSMVREAIAGMKNQDREILLLKHTEHWTYLEIAAQLGLSVDTVIYRLGRARQSLKANLTNRCSDIEIE